MCPELHHHPRLVVGDGEGVGVGEDLLERGPVVSCTTRVPVVSIGSDVIDVRISRVVVHGVPPRACVERPRHHRPHERNVRDAPGAEHVNDVTERRRIVGRRSERTEIVLGLMVEAQVDRVAEALDRVGMGDDDGVLGAVRDRAPAPTGLPVDERDPTLTDGPCLRRVRERVGPLVVVMVDREPASDLGLDPHDRVALRLAGAGCRPGAEVRGGRDGRRAQDRGIGQTCTHQGGGDKRQDHDAGDVAFPGRTRCWVKDLGHVSRPLGVLVSSKPTRLQEGLGFRSPLSWYARPGRHRRVGMHDREASIRGEGISQMLLQFIHRPEELACPHPSQVASKASTSLRRPLAHGAPGSAPGAGTTPEHASPGTSGSGGPAAGCSRGTVHV